MLNEIDHIQLAVLRTIILCSMRHFDHFSMYTGHFEISSTLRLTDS